MTSWTDWPPEIRAAMQGSRSAVRCWPTGWAAPGRLAASVESGPPSHRPGDLPGGRPAKRQRASSHLWRSAAGKA